MNLLLEGIELIELFVAIKDRVVDEIQAENHFTRTEVEKLIHFVVSSLKYFF